MWFKQLKWPELITSEGLIYGGDVYLNRPDNIEDVKQKISNEIRAIPEDFLENVIEEFRDRLGHCLAENGGHFQHLIR
ncbi:hypothetical protein NQ318_020751 [Aromia moschata]|uniref:Uncharacterized protein n=1 Tax=Aromia moschata TaxID=1265417 RepID=A0AAV8YZL2_9CUCU|nr:hypothetical protein NQ318_020751 [Aromia moschata]